MRTIGFKFYVCLFGFREEVKCKIIFSLEVLINTTNSKPKAKNWIDEHCCCNCCTPLYVSKT